MKTQEAELPRELDFFKYAQNSLGKRKVPASREPESKKRRVGFEEDEEMNEEEDNGGSQTPAPKHRVAAKGSNVPECIETFAALKDRYQIPSHIFANLFQNGYSQPTAIQSYGIPILLEVCGCMPS
jgi:ATP-dependent RNA helicase DDX52/ROK1